jgi:hypothetical protein
MKNIKITLLGIIVLLATVHGAAQTCPYGFGTDIDGCTFDFDVQVYKLNTNLVCVPCGGLIAVTGVTSSSPGTLTCGTIDANCPTLQGSICKIEVTMTAPTSIGPVANGNAQSSTTAPSCTSPQQVEMDVAFGAVHVHIAP